MKRIVTFLRTGLFGMLGGCLGLAIGMASLVFASEPSEQQIVVALGGGASLGFAAGAVGGERAVKWLFWIMAASP